MNFVINETELLKFEGSC